MARGLSFGLEVIGADAAVEDLDGISRRMRDARPAFEAVQEILQAGEERHFASLKGRYVRTGALKASLTQDSANGAIREAHADELVFGTSIYYARFLRGGRATKRGSRKSAVLVLKPLERKAASRTIMDFIMGEDV
jgi:hypothetical protein